MSIAYPKASALSLSRIRGLFKSTQFVICCLLVCSAVINVFQARKMSRLEAAISRIKSESKLREGEAVPAITAKDLDGRPVALEFKEGDLPTILYVFTPACGWCTRNLPNIAALANNSRDKYRLVGISLSNDKLREYVTDHNISFPVYGELSQATISAYKLGGTPETVVISPEGKVIKRWSGAYMENTQRQVEQFFNLSLPGIADQKEASPDKKDCEECGENAPSQPKTKS